MSFAIAKPTGYKTYSRTDRLNNIPPVHNLSFVVSAITGTNPPEWANWCLTIGDCILATDNEGVDINVRLAGDEDVSIAFVLCLCFILSSRTSAA